MGDEILSHTGDDKKDSDTSVYISIIGGRVSQDDLTRLGTLAVKKLSAGVERMKADAEKDKYNTHHFSGNCASCGKRQSWELKGTRFWPVKTAAIA